MSVTSRTARWDCGCVSNETWTEYGNSAYPTYQHRYWWTRCVRHTHLGQFDGAPTDCGGPDVTMSAT